MTTRFRTGIEVLTNELKPLLVGRRVGLVTHLAALTSDGIWSAEQLRNCSDVDLRCLLGPEHGAFGHAGAGEPVPTTTHPTWDIPVFSLFGDQRKPTSEMLNDVDVIVVDLQDLGVRCYTFVSTLQLVMKAASEQNKTLVVADRPIPYPRTVDGPMLDPELRSFVAHVSVPFVYGMTQGEIALLLQAESTDSLELHIAEMSGYQRTPYRQPDWPPWVPPSTAIRSWETAWCYPATVFCEALPSLDYGRDGPLPFQTLGARWMDGRKVAEFFFDHPLPGVRIHPHPRYVPAGNGRWELVEGVRFVVTDPSTFQPVTTGLSVLEQLQRHYGVETLWEQEGTRPHFFDQLFGTDSVRLHLLENISVRELAAQWHMDSELFLEKRSGCLVYSSHSNARAE